MASGYMMTDEVLAAHAGLELFAYVWPNDFGGVHYGGLNLDSKRARRRWVNQHGERPLYLVRAKIKALPAEHRLG